MVFSEKLRDSICKQEFSSLSTEELHKLLQRTFAEHILRFGLLHLGLPLLLSFSLVSILFYTESQGIEVLIENLAFNVVVAIGCGVFYGWITRKMLSREFVNRSNNTGK